MFITSILLGVATLVGVATVLFSRRIKHPEDRNTGIVFGAGLTGLPLVILGCMSILVVPANSVSVVTEAGRFVRTHQPGFHFVTPWSSADTFGTRNQQVILDAGDRGDLDAVHVAFAGGAQGTIDVTVTYNLAENAAEERWRRWGANVDIGRRFIQPATKAAFAAVYGKVTPQEARDGSNAKNLTEKVKEALTAELSKVGVDVDAVAISAPVLPDGVQKTMDDITAVDGRIAVARKELERAKAEAEANQARQQGLTREALIRDCLNVAREAKPLILDCGLGGGGNSVIVPGASR